MKELDLTGLEITEDDRVVRLERSPALLREAPASLPAEPVKTPPKETDTISIKSPMVGVFYASPAENAEPYVSVGDSVEKGKILCIIEAMKLMNEIYAEEGGVISEICVKNGQVVEYGTELFRIKR